MDALDLSTLLRGFRELWRMKYDVERRTTNGRVSEPSMMDAIKVAEKAQIELGRSLHDDELWYCMEAIQALLVSGYGIRCAIPMARLIDLGDEIRVNGVYRTMIILRATNAISKPC